MSTSYYDALITDRHPSAHLDLGAHEPGTR